MTAADALRRLLAKLDESLCDAKCHVDGCENPACRCCCECYTHEMTVCPDDMSALRGVDSAARRVIQRLALDGLSGEAEAQLGELCVGCGKRSRITTAACDHCDYEDK